MGGVESFVVISSYFLTKKLLKAPAGEINIFSSIKHRIIRLMPVYYLLCISAFFAIAILKRMLPIWDLFIHSAFSQNINWMITGYPSALTTFTAHTWTLSIEVWLFIVWLLAFKLLRNDRSRIIFNLVSIIFAITWRILATVAIGEPTITSLCPIAHMDAFGIGSLMAISENQQKANTKSFNWILSACGLGIILISIGVTAYSKGVTFGGAYNLYCSSSNYLNNVLTCNVYLGFSLLTVGLVELSKSFKADGKIAKVFVFLGNISYTTYLIHYPISFVLNIVLNNSWYSFFVTMIITIVLSIVIERVLEIKKHGFKNVRKIFTKGE